MENEEVLEQQSGPGIRGLWVLGGCALSVTTLFALVLLVLLLVSLSLNVYLAWTLTGYEVSISRPTLAVPALVVVTPTAELVMVPVDNPTEVPTQVPTAAPTSTPTLVPTAAPTSAPTPVPTLAPTSAPTPAPSAGALDPEPILLPATGPQVAETEVAEAESAEPEAAVSPTTNPTVTEPETSPAAAGSTPEVITYVVEQGDTLWSISARVYGVGTMWQVIFETNRDLLNDPGRIQPGLVLRIPLNP